MAVVVVATQAVAGFDPRSVKPLRLTMAVIASDETQNELEKTLESLAGDLGVTTECIVVHGVAELRALVEECASTYLMIVRSGEIVAPNAPRTICDALDESPLLCMVHAYWVPLEKDGRVSRLEHRAHRERLRRRLPASTDHRRALIAQGNILQALPTFRLESLREYRWPAEGTTDDALFAAALHVLSRGEIGLIPRALAGRLPICASRTAMPKVAVAATFRRIASRLVDMLTRELRSFLVRRGARWSPYDLFVSAAKLLPLGSLSTTGDRSPGFTNRRIAYAMTRYPLLSETFIRREVNAICNAGTDVEVIALEPDDPPMRDDPNSPAGPVFYYGPANTERARELLRGFLRARPWRVVMIWLFIVRRSEHRTRTLRGDQDVLFEAAQLAGVLAERGVTHVHSPWATRPALTAFAASRLIGATFSVEARASEVNRHLERPGLIDRIGRAEFIVANSAFVESSLRRAAGGRRMPRIHVVYNGLDLHRFVPAKRLSAESPPRQRPHRVLSVGRLVEPKGFRYLLLACDILRGRGHEFTCEIIGGPDPDDTVTWIELRRMLEELNLQDIVVFRGAATFSSVLSALEGADVFALPCVEARDGSRDVTPNSLLEAMAMALPVISTRSGAIPEIVDEGENGLLVDPGDEHALADALARLFGDPDLRLELGRAARVKVERVFDSSVNARRLEALFAAPDSR